MFDRPLGRRTIQMTGDWEDLRRNFQWRIAPRFNLANALCDSWASFDPERTALVHVRRKGGLERWSFSRLKEASDRLASAFSTAGIRRGDRVAQILAQGPESLITHFALLKIGAISVPIFLLLGDEALAFRLRDCGARGVVCDSGQLDRLMALKPDLADLSLVWTTGIASSPVRMMWDDIAAAQPLSRSSPTGLHDPAFLLYTSGSTGPPRGVLHAHRFLPGLLPGHELFHARFPQPGDFAWTTSDWAWVGSLGTVLGALWYGVPFFSHRLSRFDPERAWRVIADQSLRNLFVPPTALRMLQQVPVPPDARLRTIVTAGEPTGDAIPRWSQETLGIPLGVAYGLTECTTSILTSPELMTPKPGALGLATPGFDVAILGEDGDILPPGAKGELAIHSSAPSMFLRYWNKPIETEAAFSGEWMRTGDAGHRDEDGYFYFSGRMDDIINSSDYRLGPQEIEEAILTLPRVRQVAVVGEPDLVRNEVVVAYVVLADEGDDGAGISADVAGIVRDRVGPHAAPRRVEVVEALPTTPTGKVWRRALKRVSG